MPGPSSAPDRPAAKPAPVVASVSTTSVLSAVSLPSLTPSECDAAVQALESVTSRQLRVGCDENSVWRDRYYLLSRHLLHWMREIAYPQSSSEFSAGRAELLRNCTFEFDVTAPVQQLASALIPYYELLANENVEPDL